MIKHNHFPTLDHSEADTAQIEWLIRQNDQLTQDKQHSDKCADALGFLLLICLAIITYLVIQGMSHV